MYTGGWISIGPNPDFLCDLYNGSNYYHPGQPENYGHIETANLNGNLTALKSAPTIPLGNVSCQLAQIAFAEDAGSIPVWSNTGIKAYANEPVDIAGEGNWTHMVNQAGIGINSWWATLNTYPAGATGTYTTGTLEYGWSSTLSLENPIYSQWYWDWEVLERVYDGGAGRDPYTLATWVPQLYSNWTQGTWIDPVTSATKTSITVTLRPDVYWQDGQPVTIADIYYTLVTMSKDILAKGLPPPWFYPTVQYMRSVEILDAYHIQILMDVNAAWAVGWVIGSVVLPMHIWKPIVDASSLSNPIVEGYRPDPKLIGSGPFRWSSDTLPTAPGGSVNFVANIRGSVVNGITSPGYFLYYPIMVTITPGSFNKINIPRTTTSISETFTIATRNLYLGGAVHVDKYIYVTNSTGYVIDSDSSLNVAIPSAGAYNTGNVYDSEAGTADFETETVTLYAKNLYYVKVAEKILDAPWTNVWVNVTIPVWVTILQDIAGSNIFTDMGYTFNATLGISVATQNAMKSYATTPDLTADGRDTSAASKAFGTVPGDTRWNAVCDVNKDYTVDGRDVSSISKQFGY
jgi:hypothetical protein